MNKMKSAVAAVGLLSIFTGAADALVPVVSNDNSLGILFSTALAAEMHPAQKLVQDASAQMIAALNANAADLKRNPAHIHDLLEDNILMHIDFEKISLLVLGKHGRTATVEQRERFTAEFKKLLINTYSDAALEFSGETITVKPVRGAKPDSAMVDTVIQRASGPIDVSYSVYLTPQKEWKIRDVLVEGVSLMQKYRGETSSIIERRGGIDALIQELVNRNRSNCAALKLPTCSPM